MNHVRVVIIPFVVIVLLATGAVFDRQARATQAGAQAQQSSSAVAHDPADVRKIQQYLNDHGYKAGQVTGEWNADTVAALKRFQEDKGLEPNGQLNNQTLAAMDLQLGPNEQRAPASETPNGTSSNKSGGETQQQQ